VLRRSAQTRSKNAVCIRSGSGFSNVVGRKRSASRRDFVRDDRALHGVEIARALLEKKSREIIQIDRAGVERLTAAATAAKMAADAMFSFPGADS